MTRPGASHTPPPRSLPLLAEGNLDREEELRRRISEEIEHYFQGLEETITMAILTRSSRGGISAATTAAIATNQVTGPAETTGIRDEDMMDIEEQPSRSGTSLSDETALHTPDS